VLERDVFREDFFSACKVMLSASRAALEVAVPDDPTGRFDTAVFIDSFGLQPEAGSFSEWST
jgi:hypothetical protein